MQAKETVFADLMQGRTQQFQVPLYQRTYSWSEKQLTQLWNDILEQAEILDFDSVGHGSVCAGLDAALPAELEGGASNPGTTSPLLGNDL